MLEAGEILGTSATVPASTGGVTRRMGLQGSIDRRAGKGIGPACAGRQNRSDARSRPDASHGLNVKHFDEHIRSSMGFGGATPEPKHSGIRREAVERAARRGAHRRKWPRKPCEGMDAASERQPIRVACRSPQPIDRDAGRCDQHDLIGFLVEEEARYRPSCTAGGVHGQACRRASIPTAAAIISSRRGGRSRRQRPAHQVGRALDRSGIEHMRSIRRKHAGARSACSARCRNGCQGAQVCRHHRHRCGQSLSREVYLPAHNARFARSPQIAESAFVTLADPAPLAEILCIEDERVVARDNTIVHEGRRLQLPQSPVRAHYVKARVKVREYPDGTLAVFHGPRRIAR